MRLSTRVLARSWVVLAAAALTALPVAAPAVAATPSTARPLPHPVGGYVAGPGRTVPKAHLGLRANEVLPASVDLMQYAPAVSDQGQIGACVAWTIGYSIMGYYANRTNGSGAPYAPLFLYLRNVPKGGAPAAGLIPDNVLANAQTAGIDPQADYFQGTTDWQTAPTQAQIDNARNYRVNGWSRLFNGANQGAAAQTAVMTTLASGSPVALGIPVYGDFVKLRTHTLYNTTTGSNLGGHMIAAYGYDAQGVFIRNSWGTGWGNGGDAKLAWAFVTKAATGAYSVGGITTPATPIPVKPTVAALSAAKGPAGTSVTITGAGLSTVTSVRFGAEVATFAPQTVGAVTRLVATAPAHAVGAVDVTVTNPAGTSPVAATGRFTYVPPAPQVVSLSPERASILGGTPVTLTGTDLKGVAAVRLGTVNVPATSVTGTSLTFTPPARAAGTVPVTVTNAYGTSRAGSFTYVTPPAAVISAVTPSGGLTYKATPVVVTGTDFTGATKVTLGGVSVPFVKVSGTQLKLTLPVRPAGDLALQITTPGGVSAAGAASIFTYRAPPEPAITAITPSSGLTTARTPVVVDGVNFTDSTRLTVGGVVTPYTKISDTQLKLTLPAHAAGSVPLRLTTPGGTSGEGSDSRFTYEAPPVPAVTTLTPASGLRTVSTTVLLDGTDFTGTTKVTAGGVGVPWVKVSDTRIRVTLAPRAAGDVALVVTTPGGPSPAAIYTAVSPPLPVISELSVRTGSTKVTTPVTITGTDLGGVTRLTVGTAAVPFTRVSDTQLRATIPARAAGAVPLTVTGPGGTSAAASFAFLAPPVPVINELRPAQAPANRAATVFVLGSGFTGTTKVTAAGVPVSFTVPSDTVLRVSMPARAVGSYGLVVTGPAGSSVAGALSSFVYGL